MIATTIVVVIYAAMLIGLTATHEPWRDEGQAWLWAKALAQPIDFILIPGEGHPPLFYWLLRGLSSFLSFDQARWISPAFGILNAVLLARLLRNDVLVLFALLFSNLLLQYWGYYFRPYSMILTFVLVALLFERQGRNIAATWMMALSCGLHFLSGFLFAFWLIYRWQRGTAIVRLAPPAMLALAFGAVSLIGARGNPEGAPDILAMPGRMVEVLAWPGWYLGQPILVAILSLALLYACFRRDRFMALLLIGMTLFYAAAAGLVYGRLPWHTGFLLVMLMMSYILSVQKAQRWVFVLLLAPQVIGGIAIANQQFKSPKWVDEAIYQAVVDDAGEGFDPATDLLVWQDHLMSGIAARRDITYQSANDGAMVGPIDWRSRNNMDVWADFPNRPTPYWLVCHRCQYVLRLVRQNDQTSTRLLTLHPTTGDPLLSAYRID